MRRSLLWVIAILVLTFGLSNLLQLGIIGDDLVIVSQGLAEVSSHGLVTYMQHSVERSVSPAHILPVGGVFTSIYVVLAMWLGYALGNIAFVWELMRIEIIVGALFAASIFVRESLSGVSPTRKVSRLPLIGIFCLLSSIFVCTLQIHAVWSQDPVVSYPLASWLVLALGFAFSAVCIRLSRTTYSASRTVLLGLLAISIGLAGVFTYEVFICFPLASGVFFLITASLKRGRARSIPLLITTLVVLILPTLAFVGVQFFRLRQPSDYSGTASGFTALIVPVWKNALLGGLPLTNLPLSLQLEEGFVMWTMILPVSAAITLMWIALWKLNPQVAEFRTRGWGHISRANLVGVVGYLVVLCLSVNLIFASSAKYQVEIGTTLGHVYLNYATSALCIACGVAVIGIFLFDRFGLKPLLVICAVVILLGAVQWEINGASVIRLRADFGWRSNLVNQIVAPDNSSIRCDLQHQLKNSGMPTWYVDETLRSLDEAFALRFRNPFCGS